ncbi:MAG: protein-glutamate methylesterase/protein-glutamine glutaminase [Pseudomonadota bacterium]
MPSAQTIAIPRASNAFRVLVVDDSAVIRGLISRWLEEDPAIQVVASAANGAIALSMAKKTQPELVILDIEMPEMDGLTALPLLIEAVPGVQVIMASTLTLRNADISLRALQMGAADYIPKPESRGQVASSLDFRREVVEKVKALGAAARRTRGLMPPTTMRGPAIHDHATAEIAGAPASKPPLALSLRPMTLEGPPRVLAIGASTGGPQALFEIFKTLKNDIKIPVVLTQHMPVAFTAILADHLQRLSGIPAREGVDGETLEPGRIYVAPGDYHMLVEEADGAPRIRITQDPPENFCRPAVDPMFRSLAKVYGPRVLSVILTGMGQDGLKGAREVVAGGGILLAQDAATSVVWGMPGTVAKAGICHAVLPLGEIAPRLKRLLRGESR